MGFSPSSSCTYFCAPFFSSDSIWTRLQEYPLTFDSRPHKTLLKGKSISFKQIPNKSGAEWESVTLDNGAKIIGKKEVSILISIAHRLQLTLTVIGFEWRPLPDRRRHLSRLSNDLFSLTFKSFETTICNFIDHVWSRTVPVLFWIYANQLVLEIYFI